MAIILPWPHPLTLFLLYTPIPYPSTHSSPIHPSVHPPVTLMKSPSQFLMCPQFHPSIQTSIYFVYRLLYTMAILPSDPHSTSTCLFERNNGHHSSQWIRVLSLHTSSTPSVALAPYPLSSSLRELRPFRWVGANSSA